MAIEYPIHAIGPFSRPVKLITNPVGFYIHPASPGIPGWGYPWTTPPPESEEIPPPGTPHGTGQIRHIYHPPSAEEWGIHHQPGDWVYGNIDWAGKKRKPEKENRSERFRLSYWGPQSRYFRDPNFNYGDEEKHNEIYETGKYLSVAPLPVLGAALQTFESAPDPITQEVTKQTYLIAICKDDFADEIFVRVKPESVLAADMTPTIRNEMMKLWDFENNPQGWISSGYIPQFIDGSSFANEADTPWFFNASGNECQCMRSWDYNYNNGMRVLTEADVKFRYKVTIEIVTLGDLPEVQIVTTNLRNKNFNQTESTTIQTGFWGRMGWSG